MTEDTDTQEGSLVELTFQDCIGARSLKFDECSEYIFADPVFPPESANEARPQALSNGCHMPQERPVEFKSCYYGKLENFTETVALVGDSHATHWIPALDAAANDAGIRIKTYLMSGCFLGSYQNTKACAEFTSWTQKDLRAIKNEISYVLISNRTSTGRVQENFLGIMESFSEEMHLLSESYNDIYVIGDNPLGSLDNSDPNLCLISSEPQFCVNYEDSVTFPSPYIEALSTTGIGKLIPVQQLFCSEGECPLSIGGIPVYRDDDHITSQYSISTSDFWLSTLFEK